MGKFAEVLFIESKSGAKYSSFTFEFYLASQVMTAFEGLDVDLIFSAYY